VTFGWSVLPGVLHEVGAVGRVPARARRGAARGLLAALGVVMLTEDVADQRAEPDLARLFVRDAMQRGEDVVEWDLLALADLTQRLI
jgi:hypothetical protein